MKILNKFIWSKTEPKNKNDIWFDGSVFKRYSQGEWKAFTVPIEAADQITKLIEDFYSELDDSFASHEELTAAANNIISLFRKEIKTEGFGLIKLNFDTNQFLITNPGGEYSPIAVWFLNRFLSLQNCGVGVFYVQDGIPGYTTADLYVNDALYPNIRFSIGEYEYTGVFDGGFLTGFNKVKRTKELISNVTYEELLSLVNDKKLIPGMQYRIIDYQTTTAQENTYSANNQFDIIVVADSDATLNEVAKACIHEGDTYFTEADANLAAWKIWYCLYNDTQRFAWAFGEDDVCAKITSLNEGTDHNLILGMNVKLNTAVGTDFDYYVDILDYPYSLKDGEVWNEYAEKVGTYIIEKPKGVIYYMKDEWGNECPYDFKNIKFKRGILDTGEMVKDNEADMFRYFYTFSYKDEYGNVFDTSIVGNNGEFTNDEGVISGVYNNVINKKLYSDIGIQLQCLNEIIFYAYYDYDSGAFYGYSNNNFDVDCENIILSSGSNNNTFKARCSSNILKEFCSNNTFGINCYDNILESQCKNNTFGNKCSNNELGRASSYNIFKQDCQNNTLGNKCNGNTFDTGCYNNKFQNDCCYNTLGSMCRNNTFGEDYSGDKFYYNTLESDVRDNLFIAHVYSPLTKAQYYHICSGVTGLDVGVNRGRNYKTTVAINSTGEEKYFCEADLVL